jgi:hypothetical protein
VARRGEVDVERAANVRFDARVGCEETGDARARRPRVPGLVERGRDLDLLVDRALGSMHRLQARREPQQGRHEHPHHALLCSAAAALA